MQVPPLRRLLLNCRLFFNVIQTQLSEHKLLLNVDKTKVMLFSKAKKTPETTLDIVTTKGKVLEVVTCYKYLGIWLDDCLSFKLQVINLLRNLRVKRWFLFQKQVLFLT